MPSQLLRDTIKVQRLGTSMADASSAPRTPMRRNVLGAALLELCTVVHALFLRGADFRTWVNDARQVAGSGNKT